MSYYSGTDGSLYVDGTRMARVASWSLTANVDTLETTSLGDNERCYTPGLKSASGSASVFYHDDAPVGLLNKVIKTGAATESDIVTLKLGWGEKQITVTAIVASAELTSQVGAVMQANITYTVTDNYVSVDL